MSVHLDFPFRIDATGRTATTSDDGHVRDMIEQLLFTVPGERVNRPDFGAGALRLVFAGNSADLAGATEYVLQSGLAQALADDVEVIRLTAVADEAVLRIEVDYRRRSVDRTVEVVVTRSRP